MKKIARRYKGQIRQWTATIVLTSEPPGHLRVGQEVILNDEPGIVAGLTDRSITVFSKAWVRP